MDRKRPRCYLPTGESRDRHSSLRFGAHMQLEQAINRRCSGRSEEMLDTVLKLCSSNEASPSPKARGQTQPLGPWVYLQQKFRLIFGNQNFFQQSNN